MKKVLIGLLFLSLTMLAQSRQKIIFDCDFGGDVDDAFAVALILASPEFEVLGLVMDHGNTPLRARTAGRMLYEVGLENDIPIVMGRHTPGIVGEETELAGRSNQFIWSDGFDKVKPIEQNATDFIIENLRKYPDEVILFTVGPVCNMQDVIEKDPEALKLAKKIVSMFGSFYMGYNSGPIPDPEWNVRADVKASQKFMNSGADITLAGLDVTTFVKISAEDRTRLLMRQSPLTNSLCGLYTLWRYESYAYPNSTMFDGVAVGMVLWPELFTTRKAHVTVDEKGFTVIDEGKEPNCEIGMTINKDEFLIRMMDRLLKQNLMRID
ncbi:MAG: nucleoside hydrolase [Labilibaculum sp.]|nr:nucleoside hydrolase [Labilibaculum sp.]MBI9060229.1 nucleoside hydrolase [Labilibaculum sp.]